MSSISNLAEDESSKVGEYILERKLGDGSYGTVYLALHSRSHEEFAIKHVPAGLTRGGEKGGVDGSPIVHEATIMQGLHHPHVVRLIQVISTPEGYYLVMELADGGELFKTHGKSNKLTEGVVRRYFQQLISAIYYCHGKGVAHRDLKAENLLLTKTDQLKVCDFGFSCFQTASNEPNLMDVSLNGTEVGTISYMPPEMLSQKNIMSPFQHDTWASGVILYQMLTGHLPFEGRSEEETIHKIVKSEVNFEVLNGVPGAKKLIKGILASDIDERLSLEDIIRNPWFMISLDRSLFPNFHFIELRHIGSCRDFLDFSKDRAIDLSDEEEIVIKRAFENICKGEDKGVITKEELRDVLILLRPEKPAKESEVRSLMNHFVPTAKDFITYEEFRNAWVNNDLANTLSGTESASFQLKKLISIPNFNIESPVSEKLREMFNQIDKGRKGYVTSADWNLFFKYSKIEVEEEEIKHLVKFLDGNGFEYVTFEDFATGVVKRDLLTKHKIGRRLSKAVNLDAFSANKLSLNHLKSKFTAVGDMNNLMKKIVEYDPNRLKLCEKHQTDSNLLEATFRFTNICQPHSISMCTSLSSRLASCDECDLGSSEGSASNFEAALESNRGSPVSDKSDNFKNIINSTKNNQIRSDRNIKNEQECDLNVILAPISHQGYTAVQISPVSGRESVFKDAAIFIARSLENEQEQAVIDCSPVGDGEIM